MNDLAILRLADGLARHSALRHRLVAENVAHADTPGYKARDLQSFDELVPADFAMRATREGHLAGQANQTVRPILDSAFGSESPNGNDVNVTDQIARATQAMGNHDKAVTVYKKTLDILRMGLGRGGR
jgi:flagellar basal-body rod protein FlgB